jgi:hypothetical protein
MPLNDYQAVAFICLVITIVAATTVAIDLWRNHRG